MAAGQLPRILVRLLLQPHQLQHIGDAPAQLPGGGADGPHGKGQVLIHRLFLNEPEVLENDAQRPPHVGHLSRTDVVHVVAVHHQPPLCGGDLPGDQLDDGGLPGAGWPHQKDELPVVDPHGDPFQRLGPVVVFFIYIDEPYHVSLRQTAATPPSRAFGTPSPRGGRLMRFSQSVSQFVCYVNGFLRPFCRFRSYIVAAPPRNGNPSQKKILAFCSSKFFLLSQKINAPAPDPARGRAVLRFRIRFPGK